MPEATSTPATDTSGADPYRLPRIVTPSRYDLVLEPDLAAFTFAGTCATTVEVSEPTDTLVLNAIELEVTKAWAVSDGGAMV